MIRNLLYVDDEPINLQLLQISLKKAFNVITADSGAEGLLILKNNADISIVISDMKMPQMDGIEFITEAKSQFPNKQYYILTGYDTTPEIGAALDSGLIIEKFKKPFKAKEMTAYLLDKIED